MAFVGYGEIPCASWSSLSVGRFGVRSMGSRSCRFRSRVPALWAVRPGRGGGVFGWMGILIWRTPNEIRSCVRDFPVSRGLGEARVSVDAHRVFWSVFMSPSFVVHWGNLITSLQLERGGSAPPEFFFGHSSNV